MRIIAGEKRSRRLLAPEGMDTRPTADRTKEALFSILLSRLPGARVLDLYAGSGALALEALSRGAAFAVLADQSPQGLPSDSPEYRGAGLCGAHEAAVPA